MNPKPQVKKVVLAYSGGLDTSVIVPWLKENYGCEVSASAPMWARAMKTYPSWKAKPSPAAPASLSSMT
jgi:PP-loop superfamily ATP-utilizing enzyme